MADPFRVLRAPVTSADPDPGFAARLRARLERALDLPEGVVVSETGALRPHHPAPVAATRRRGVREPAAGESGGRARGARGPRQGDIGYASLWVPDVHRAAAFYAAVLGWEYAPAGEPGSRRVPATAPPQGLWGGEPRPTLFCSYVVDDAALTVARVRAAGGQAGDPVARPYGLSADCEDDQGTRFAVHQPPAPGRGARTGPEAPGRVTTGRAARSPGAAGASGQAAAARDGDIAYVTLEVVDSRRARDFYGAVLGWQFVPGRVADGWQVVGPTPMIGMSGGHAEATAVPMWRVADLQGAVGRVTAAGGTATEPRREPYGLTADCADDQGTRFYLGQFPER
jgi:predicted enzyme related to lactoylglutathione lyase